MKIIKMTSWHLDYNCGRPMLRKGQFFHAVWHPEEDEFDILLTPRGTRFFQRLKREGAAADDHRGWALVEDEDEWEEIPEDQWPDEVCVALAKDALLGENASEE